MLLLSRRMRNMLSLVLIANGSAGEKLGGGYVGWRLLRHPLAHRGGHNGVGAVGKAGGWELVGSVEV